ncbi:unnamed protein product [Effrenium voratum]|nr:unnamed protein product [Effrenium voratum]
MAQIWRCVRSCREHCLHVCFWKAFFCSTPTVLWLKGMLSEEDVDPEMLSHIDDIQKQLEELKAGQANLSKAQQEMEMLQRTRKQNEQADSAWAASCFAMSTETLGGSLSKEDMQILERLAKNDLSREEAAQLPLLRMAMVCFGKKAEGGEVATAALDLLHKVTSSIRRGQRPPDLPRDWVEYSESPEAIEKMQQLSASVWAQLRAQAQAAVHNSDWKNKGPPLFFLTFALPIPMYQLCQWLLRTKWRERRPAELEDKEGEAKQKEEPKKEAKKEK